MKFGKWLIVLIIFPVLPIVLLTFDKIYGRSHINDFETAQLQAEIGDLIFRSNSYFLAGGKYFYKSVSPGHLAIVVSEGKFSGTDETLGNIQVAESAVLNRYQKRFQTGVAVNKAFENFGNIPGRRFLLKMHLNDIQKKKLVELVTSQIGKPYSLLSTKNNPSSFHCATFARWVILEVAGIDLDSDGGFLVFPNDILRSSRFDQPGDRQRF
jgi:hypothetical protein